MPSNRVFFSFAKSDIDAAFQAASPKIQYRGLKLLQSLDHPKHGKLLIVIPRACGKAHDRNRIRRQLRAIFYEHQLYQNKTVWILLVRKDALALDFATLTQFLTKACGRGSENGSRVPPKVAPG